MAVLYQYHNLFEHAVFAFGFPLLAEAHAEHGAECLPEGGSETTQEGFYKLVGRLVALPVDETYQ